jgi:hypothetical protein
LPVPEITFAGQVDEALPPENAVHVLDMLRLALGAVGKHAARTSIGVEAAEDLSFVVTADGDTADGDLSPLLHRASQAGFAVEIEPVPGGTRLTWKVPVRA